MPRPARRWLPKLVFCFLAVAVIGCVAAFWRAEEHEELIAEAAKRAGVDHRLLKAIAWHQSGFDAAKQQDGGYGLMQLGAGTGIEWAASRNIETFMVTDLLDARTNLHAGAWYLGRVLQRWHGTDNPAAFALAEYFAGPDAVHAWAGDSRKAEDLMKAMSGTPTAAFVSEVLDRAGLHP